MNKTIKQHLNIHKNEIFFIGKVLQIQPEREKSNATAVLKIF